jgi:2-keto-4-pentenoate hydratase/2-oxohepta-3-ene-1,7-dioic acid hydratase in catechol pathway
VSAAAALDHVGWYAPLNDVTARDLQRADGQWTRGKGFDTFCPIGAAVAAAEVDPAGLEVIGRVNGVVRQQGSAAQMAFPIPVLIEYISAVMTLEPGDVIATGTPAGVGPLQPGDIVEVEIPGIGILRNPVKER